MTQLQNFQHIERLPGYDKIRNPSRLTISDLTPVGASWEYDGHKIEISGRAGILAVPLENLSGVAVVEAPFETGGQNKAYVLNSDGTKCFDMKKPMKYMTLLFSDVYYVGGTLCFFLSGSLGDFRLSVNESDGSILAIEPSR